MKHESAPGGNEKKGRIFGFLKKFNKISAAVLLSAGVIFNSGTLLALGAIDVAQSMFFSKLEKSRKSSKSAKNVGRAALAH